MTKETLTTALIGWLASFLKRNFSDKFEVMEVFSPESSLSKLNNKHLKSISNYSAWDFAPDVLALLLDKATGKAKVVFVNRSTSALSLKEIGEIHCYAKLADAELAFLVSTNGLSNEVSLLLLENDIRTRLLNYSGQKEIVLFSWSEELSAIDANSIMPLEKRHLLLI